MNLFAIKRRCTALAGLLALCVFLSTPLVMTTHHHSEDLSDHCALCILSSASFIDASPPQVLNLHPEESDGPRLESDTVVALDARTESPARAPPSAA